MKPSLSDEQHAHALVASAATPREKELATLLLSLVTAQSRLAEAISDILHLLQDMHQVPALDELPETLSGISEWREQLEEEPDAQS